MKELAVPIGEVKSRAEQWRGVKDMELQSALDSIRDAEGGHPIPVSRVPGGNWYVCVNRRAEIMLKTYLAWGKKEVPVKLWG